jgi:hypothetical protein
MHAASGARDAYARRARLVEVTEVGISKSSKYHIQYLLACQVSGAISICLPRTSKYLYLLEIYINAKTEV